jgi:hypothetical protein
MANGVGTVWVWIVATDDPKTGGNEFVAYDALRGV